jgi:ERCC4-type nuclease
MKSCTLSTEMNVTCFLMSFRIDYVLEMNNKNNVDETSNLVHAMKSKNFVKQNSKPHQYTYGTSYNARLISSLTSSSKSECASTNKGKGHPITGHQGPRGGVEV